MCVMGEQGPVLNASFTEGYWLMESPLFQIPFLVLWQANV